MSSQKAASRMNQGEQFMRLRPLFSWQRLLAVFLVIAIASCTAVVLSVSLVIETRGNLAFTGALVLGNVLFLSNILLALEALWHMVTIRRPLRRILAGLARIEQGDFSARIAPIHDPARVAPGKKWRPNEFDIII